jgi:hypothetical protein
MSKTRSVTMYRETKINRANFNILYSVTIWHLGFPNPNGTFKVVLKLNNRTRGIQEFYNWMAAVNFCKDFVDWGLSLDRFDVQGSSTYSAERLRELLSNNSKESKQ